jgi:hypothetical protein
VSHVSIALKRAITSFFRTSTISAPPSPLLAMERNFRIRPPSTNAYSTPFKGDNETQFSFSTSHISSDSATIQNPPFSFAQKLQNHSKSGIPNNIRLQSQPRSAIFNTSRPLSISSDSQQQRVRQIASTKHRNVIPFNLDTSLPLKYEDHEIPKFQQHTSTLSDEFSPNDSSSPVRSTDRSNFQHFGDRTLVSNDLKLSEGAKGAVKGGEDDGGCE